jgi:hypothetical protein
MRDITQDVENIKLHGGLLHSTKGRHSTRTSRWEADLRVSVTRPAFGKERSDAGSGCWMAFDEFGTMQMCVDDGGTMWRGVCWW